MSSTFSTNLSMENPTPLDPLVANAWGTIENTGRNIIDAAIAGNLTLSVAGGVNVVLTDAAGAVSQSHNRRFIFTGALTANIIVLWPGGKSRVFNAVNNTTGAFTLSCGANNGAGGAAGTTVAVPQGSELSLASDGTNVVKTSLAGPASSTDGNVAIFSGASGGLLKDGGLPPFAFASGTKMLFAQATAPTGWTQVATFNDQVVRAVSGATGGSTGGSWTISGLTYGGVGNVTDSHAITTAELPAHSHGVTISDPGHAHFAPADTGGGGTGPSVAGFTGVAGVPEKLTSSATTGITASDGSVGSGTAHAHTISSQAVTSGSAWRPAYVDCLVASKN